MTNYRAALTPGTDALRKTIDEEAKNTEKR